MGQPHKTEVSALGFSRAQSQNSWKSMEENLPKSFAKKSTYFPHFSHEPQGDQNGVIVVELTLWIENVGGGMMWWRFWEEHAYSAQPHYSTDFIKFSLTFYFHFFLSEQTNKQINKWTNKQTNKPYKISRFPSTESHRCL